MAFVLRFAAAALAFLRAGWAKSFDFLGNVGTVESFGVEDRFILFSVKQAAGQPTTISA